METEENKPPASSPSPSVLPDEPLGSPHGRGSDALFSLLLVGGYASVLIALSFLASVSSVMSDVYFDARSVFQLGCLALGLVGLIVLVKVYLRIRKEGRRPWMRSAIEVLVFGILPLWGLAYNHDAPGSCSVSSCSRNSTALRPLAEPEVYAFLALHAVVVLAYAISRRRKDALRPVGELLLLAFLMVGVTMQALLGAHFGLWLLAGIVFPPAFLPCLSPILASGLYFYELRDRLRARGEDARAKGFGKGNDFVYRGGPAQQVALGGIDVPTLRRAFLVYPAILGLYAVLTAVWIGEASAAIQVFTRTCDYTFSTIPVEIIPADCHYLCTVAARGHARLVRPYRLGRRGGKTIVVNRQLAIANAFEDLLHERMPRCGRLARRTYDRLARPVCQYLRSPWISDLVYLGMKPFELGFYLALLLFDKKSPEDRIDRMYR